MEEVRCKKYRQSDKGKESIKKRTKKYKSSEKGKQWYKNYVEKNRDKINQYQKNRRRVNLPSLMLAQAKQRAKLKNIEFSISKEDIIIPSHCPILGIELKIGEGIGGCRDSSPSLDRIDSTKGYIKGNVMVISLRANMLKNNATVEELERVINFLKGEK